MADQCHLLADVTPTPPPVHFAPPPLDQQGMPMMAYEQPSRIHKKIGLPEEALQGDLDWLLGPRWEAMRAEAAAGGWLISPEELEMGPLLGSGAFGSTYRATWRGRDVAVKCVAVQGEAQADMFSREVQLLMRVRHPNVLTLYGTGSFLVHGLQTTLPGACLWPAKHCWLVTELMEEGSLHQWLYGRNPHTAGYALMLHSSSAKVPITGRF